MVSEEDFITLAYTPELTEASLAYTLKRHTRGDQQEDMRPTNTIRQTVVEIAVELAIRRHFSQEGIPYQTAQIHPFSDPDHPEIIIGGRKCTPISFLISRKRWITKVRKEPKLLLTTPILINEERLKSCCLNQEDILIIAILNGLITTTKENVARAVSAAQPIYQIYLAPPSLMLHSQWQALAPITCTSLEENPTTLNIGGLDMERNYITETIQVPPRIPKSSELSFYTVSYLSRRDISSGTIKLNSQDLPAPISIKPQSWRNIWIYGLEILLVGFITCGEFLKQAQTQSIGSPIFKYHHTQRKTLTLPIAQLSPLSFLYSRARAWYKT